MGKDKLLFTPGPLTTDIRVKEAMLTDLGSRDDSFAGIVRNVRAKLLELAEVRKDEYEAVILQGPGTYGVEAIISSSLPVDGHLLVVINGAYGERIAGIAQVHQIRTTVLRFPENEWPSADDIRNILEVDDSITHVAVVHSETTTGIINDIKTIGEIVNQSGKIFIVDAMSSFGAVPFGLKECHIDFMVSSSNKCIEGVPGFTFIICKKDVLEKCKNQSRTLSLDLYAQWEGLETTGQFRFTPPTHTILAFYKALLLLEEEGGITARAGRYETNHRLLVEGMEKMGFQTYLDKEKQGYIITSFIYPSNEFDFNKFYRDLNEKGFVIYPGKLSRAACFRIGHIGQIHPEDIRNLLTAINEVINNECEG